jgi:hypothetical protein
VSEDRASGLDGSSPLSIKARTFFQNHSGSTRIAEAIISLMRADAASGSPVASGRAW